MGLITFSGIHQLDTQTQELLASLGLTVPQCLTSAQLTTVLSQADAIQARMTNPMVSGVTREMLDELKQELAGPLYQ